MVLLSGNALQLGCLQIVANIRPWVLTWVTYCLAFPESQAALLPNCLSAYGVTSICPGEK